jgi:quercetin dioxygenase-like cupin family protein
MIETISVGGLTLEFLQTRDKTGGSMDMFRFSAAPKARMQVPHYHESWDEAVYGLGGEMLFTLDGKDIWVRPGESLFIKRGVVHGFRNETTVPAPCLSVLSPGALGVAYFREIAALAEKGSAPDPVRMKDVMLRHGLIPVPPKT